MSAQQSQDSAACQNKRTTISVPSDSFNSATARINAAKALLGTMGIFVSEASDENGRIPVAPMLLAEAMNGVSLLLEGATDLLLTKSTEPTNICNGEGCAACPAKTIESA